MPLLNGNLFLFREEIVKSHLEGYVIQVLTLYLETYLYKLLLNFQEIFNK